jgi:hypothetical protein
VITVSEDYNTIEGIIDGLVDKFNSLAIQDLTASKLSPIEIQIHYEVLPSAVRQIETIEFRTSGKSIWLSEVARTERTMWVNIWAPTVEKRSLFAAAINLDFGTFTDPSNPGVSNIVTMPDGTTARAFLQPDIISDDEQTQKNWRQTITLGMEYATTVEVEKTEILATQPSFTVEQPPGTSGGPGRRVRPGVFCVFDPWVIEQLEKLSIFDPSSDCG